MTSLDTKWIRRLMFVSVVLGILLRFAWTSDMEYKYDEHYMFDRSQSIGVTEPWPMLGMSSGVGLRNPGMSTWIFVALAKVGNISEPVGLVQAVILLNCLALLVLSIFVVRAVPGNEREPWLWATILLAVNPVAIQLQRKIWAQSVLPIFCMFFIWAWLKRRTRVGSFFWGFMGPILGQIHMSGFFFAAAIFIWSLRKEGTKWGAWIVGSVIGSIPMLPWIAYSFQHSGESVKAPLHDLLEFSFWRNWITEPMGLSIGDSVGIRALKGFMSWPDVGDVSTYGIGILHLVGLALAIAIMWVGVQPIWKDRKNIRKNWMSRLMGQTDTTKATHAGIVGFGGMMNLARVYAHRHYLIVALPIQYVWFGKMALARIDLGRKLLVGIWVVQLLISAGFLTYIHVNGGVEMGPYGVAYANQGTDRNVPVEVKNP
jgi:hypothetical protein